MVLNHQLKKRIVLVRVTEPASLCFRFLFKIWLRAGDFREKGSNAPTFGFFNTESSAPAIKETGPKQNKGEQRKVNKNNNINNKTQKYSTGVVN